MGRTADTVEPATGTVILRNLDGAAGLQVAPLEGAGRRMAGRIPARKTADGWEITIGDPVTTWYEIKVDRQ